VICLLVYPEDLDDHDNRLVRVTLARPPNHSIRLESSIHRLPPSLKGWLLECHPEEAATHSITQGERPDRPKSRCGLVQHAHSSRPSYVKRLELGNNALLPEDTDVGILEILHIPVTAEQHCQQLLRQ
jgi:hypothetical protein